MKAAKIMLNRHKAIDQTVALCRFSVDMDSKTCKKQTKVVCRVNIYY